MRRKLTGFTLLAELARCAAGSKCVCSIFSSAQNFTDSQVCVLKVLRTCRRYEGYNDTQMAEKDCTATSVIILFDKQDKQCLAAMERKTTRIFNHFKAPKCIA